MGKRTARPSVRMVVAKLTRCESIRPQKRELLEAMADVLDEQRELARATYSLTACIAESLDRIAGQMTRMVSRG